MFVDLMCTWLAIGYMYILEFIQQDALCMAYIHMSGMNVDRTSTRGSMPVCCSHKLRGVYVQPNYGRDVALKWLFFKEYHFIRGKVT